MSHRSANRARHRAVALAALSLPMLAANTVRADSTWAWFGQSNLTTWSSSVNWFSHTIPVSSPLTHITFGGSWGPVSVQDRADPFQLNTLAFDANSRAYSIRGQALQFEAGSQVSGITQSSPNVQAIQAPLRMNADVTLSGTGGLNLLAPISDTGAHSLSQSGSGTVLLQTGALSAAGRLQVFGGGLTIDGGTFTTTATPDLDNIAVFNNSRLILQSGAKVSSVGDPEVYGGGSVLLDGSGTSWTGSRTTVIGTNSPGTITVQNGASMSSGSLILGYLGAGNGTLAVTSGGIVNSAGAVVGQVASTNGNVLISGMGSTWNVGGDLNLGRTALLTPGGTGTVTISAGAAVNVPAATTLWTASSRITIDGGSLTSASLHDVNPGSSIVLQSDPVGGAALTITGTGANGSFGGNISGAGSLRKTGNSLQHLSGTSNSYTGPTIIDAGAIVLDNPYAGPFNSTVAIKVNDGLSILGFVGTVTIGNLTGSGNLNLGTVGLDVGGNSQSPAPYTGSITSTTGSVTKSGTGTLTLAGASNVLHDLTVGSGALVLSGGTTSFNSSGQSLLVGSGASLIVRNAAALHTTTDAVVTGTAQSPGMVAVTGAGSTWSPDVFASIGAGGHGVLSVASGAQVGNGGAFIRVGVTSAGATGAGTIDISGAASVIADTLVVGASPGNVGTLNVRGAGSTVSARELDLGGLDPISGGAAANLTISNGASVNATFAASLWSDAAKVTIDGGTLVTRALLGMNGSNIVLASDPAGGAGLMISNAFNDGGNFYGLISGPGSLLKLGEGGQNLNHVSNTYSGGTRVDGGYIQLSANDAAGTGPITVNGTGGIDLNGFSQHVSALSGNGVVTLGSSATNALTLTGNLDSSFTGTLAGSGSLVKNGAARQTLGGTFSVGATVVNSGTLALSGNVNRTSSLLITGSGRADLTDRSIIIDYAGASPLPTIRGYIASARNHGTWTGAGLTSSSAAAQPSHATTLGLLEGSEYRAIYGPNATLGGVAVDDSAVLVKYTWYGDTDLNGKVNFDDYVRIDNGFNNHLTGWLNGDFDLNGQVNFDDYVLIDLAFNVQSGTLGRALGFLNGSDRSADGMSDPALHGVQQHAQQFGDAYARSFLAAVPEPASAVVFAFAGLTLAGRRRKSRHG